MYIPKGLPDMIGAELQFVVYVKDSKDGCYVAQWTKGTTLWECYWNGLDDDYKEIYAYPILEDDPICEHNQTK